MHVDVFGRNNPWMDEVPRAVDVDPFCGDLRRQSVVIGTDLDHYEAIADEFGGRCVLDLSCGTGTFAYWHARGLKVLASLADFGHHLVHRPHS